MNEREKTVKKIIKLIINELEEPKKGNLTTKYTIGILQEAIAFLESNALMCPASYSLKDES
ncbi:MAG: hypothetical protein H6Q71_1479 [Firmicutes bacterium]|nr:hypothetical protein [Bacillota bacterium]